MALSSKRRTNEGLGVSERGCWSNMSPGDRPARRELLAEQLKAPSTPVSRMEPPMWWSWCWLSICWLRHMVS